MGATTTVYLRGVPRKVIQEAKAEAARRGQTLGTVVSDAIVRSLAVGTASRAEVEDDFAADMAWYEAHREAISLRYGDGFVAVVEREVVDHDEDSSKLAARVFERYGARSIYMPRVGGEAPEKKRFRSPRVVRSRRA